MRIDEPRGNRDRAKIVLTAIVRAGRDGIIGRTRLYKAFYAAHLEFFRETGRALTPWPIVRMPRGPGIGEGDELLDELEAEAAIQAEPTFVGPYPTSRYRPGPNADRYALESPEARAAVQRAVAWVETRSAAELSAETHEFSRAWLGARDGDELDIALDTMTDEEYAVVTRHAEAAEREIGDLFAKP